MCLLPLQDDHIVRLARISRREGQPQAYASWWKWIRIVVGLDLLFTAIGIGTITGTITSAFILQNAQSREDAQDLFDQCIFMGQIVLMVVGGVIVPVLIMSFGLISKELRFRASVIAAAGAAGGASPTPPEKPPEIPGISDPAAQPAPVVLLRLADLVDRGLLTREEFDMAKKQALLGASGSKATILEKTSI